MQASLLVAMHKTVVEEKICHVRHGDGENITFGVPTEGWEKTWGKLSQDETVRQKWFRRAHRPVNLTDDYILQAIHRYVPQ